MKRNIVLCAALAAVISLSACGANGETTETTSKSAQEQTTISEAAEDNEVDEEETTAETTAETEPEVEVTHKISSTECFRNGTFAFEVPGSDGKKQFYLYDIAEKKMTKVNESLDLYDIDDVSGNLIYTLSDGTYHIYNAATGEDLFESDMDKSFIISPANRDPDKDLYYMQHVLSDDVVFVGKTTTAFSGNKSELGCIGTDGSWIMPMTAGTQYFNGKRFYTNSIDSDYILVKYVNEPGYSYFIYDVKNDKRVCEDKFKEGFKFVTHPEGSDYCYMLNLDQPEIVKYDLKNDCIAESILNGKAFDYYTKLIPNGNFIVSDPYAPGEISVLDTATDTITKFDLTQYADSHYDAPKGHMVYDNYILAYLANNGTYYTGVFDQSGEPVFEPMEGEQDYYYSNDYILLFNSEVYNLFNVKSGEFKTDTYDNDNYSFSGFDEVTGTLLVRVKDSEDGKEYYYLADISDPMNYYDPFEK